MAKRKAGAQIVKERDQAYADYQDLGRVWHEDCTRLEEEIARLRAFIQAIADSPFDEDGHPQQARKFLAETLRVSKE